MPGGDKDPQAPTLRNREGRKGTVPRSLLRAEEEKRHVGRLEKVSRCSQQFDLVSSGTEVGFGARLARKRTRFIITPHLSAGTVAR